MHVKTIVADKRSVVKNTSSLFPPGLNHVESPPKQLFVVGAVENLIKPSLAIVGARKATPYGLNCAGRFAKLAANHDIVIVSGGAIGCDQAAHNGALTAGGKTIVVLGCGADVVYPAGARALFEQVLEAGGTLVSEAPWGSPPTRWGFKKRNRIIAGLAQTTLIVEAGLPSGTFSTADATLSQGKEVLSIPGSIFAKESKGANALIAQGAIPIIDDASFCDALHQLFGGIVTERLPGFDTIMAEAENTGSGAQPRNPTDEKQGRILEMLRQEPRNAESLLGICGDDVTQVIRFLSAMEFVGLIARLRDGRYTLPVDGS